jgi:hypothetical protein
MKERTHFWRKTMKAGKSTVRMLATAALFAAAGAVTPSEAAVLTVTPSSQTIAPGGTAGVDIVLSGLAPTETVGGFSFLLSFSNGILGAPGSFTLDPGVVLGAGSLDLSGGFGAGTTSPLDVFMLADLALSDAQLKAAEGTGFTLAHVSLAGLAEGLSPLNLSVSPSQGGFLSAFDGVTLIPATAVNGSVCVDDPATPGNRCAANVPEPGTIALALIGAGFTALVGRRRRKLELQD